MSEAFYAAQLEDEQIQSNDCEGEHMSKTGQLYMSELEKCYDRIAELEAMIPQWETIDSAPRDGSKFLTLIGGIIYLGKYDKHARFIWYMHLNRAPGSYYKVHEIDDKKLLEEIKSREYDYQPSGVCWKRGFQDKPTHWMPLPPTPSNNINNGGGE